VTTPPPALRVDKLSFAYPQQPPLLDTLSFTIQPGERVGFIGLNGSGKTTLFLLLCGVLTPTAGTITLFGNPVVPGAFRPEIGMVFQNPDDQLFAPTVRDDIAFGPTNMGLPPDEIAARVAESLALTATEALAERAPHHLSGGEKRMVAIAGVLAMRPRLVLYDEPDANLDRAALHRLMAFLQTSQETILLSSHNLECVQAVCTRVILLHRGELAADAPPQTVLDSYATSVS
jgi:cobalt/nickel transport system ATP-binding protein